jgi:sugar lactone lactonase YvrE
MSATTSDFEPRPLAAGFAFLEAPRWHDGRLWFSDFNTHRVHRLDPDGTVATVCEVPHRPSGLGFTSDGDLLVVSMLDHRLLRLSDGVLTEFADLSPYQGGPANDLVTDDFDRAYIGNFGADTEAGEPERSTCLVRVDPDGAIHVVAEDLEFPNGMAITADRASLVVAESLACRISVFDLARDGTLSNRQVWADFSPRPSAFTFAATHGGGYVVPDGVCLDVEDALWVTDAGGHQVLRVRRGGEVTHRIDCGDSTAYACVLGGQDGRSLYLCIGPPFGTYDRDTDFRGELWVADVDVPGPVDP